MGQASILIVEDDADINGVMADHLSGCGYACTQAYSGTEARLLLEHGAFDLVICDLMLPGMTGEEIVGRLRAQGSATPVIVVSARTLARDKVDLLTLGADDYMTKPFDLHELAARVAVQLRRAHAAQHGGNALHAGAWTLDCDARTLSVRDEEVPLTRIEFNIVELLAKHPGRVYTKRELFELAWGEPYAADDSTLGVHMSNIRAKLKRTGTDSYIKTVWGLGFRLDADE